MSRGQGCTQPTERSYEVRQGRILICAVTVLAFAAFAAPRDAFAVAGDFTAPATSPEPAGIQPTSVAVGDLNNDGHPDQAVANQNSNDVTILLGDGTGNFTAAAGSPEAAGTGPRAVTIGDFDANGKDDLAVANQSSNNVTILLGDGTGNFSAAATSPEAVGSSPQSVAVGDFDANGKDDLAVVNQASHNVTILLGDGTGNFSAAAASPEAVDGFPRSIAVGDFDANGKDDLAVLNQASINVTILLGDGTGNFTAAGISPATAGVTPLLVVVGDFDGNGKDDLAVATFGTDNVTILLGDGTGNFTVAAGSPESAGSSPTSVAVGDFDANGKDDLAVANSASNNVTILLGDGTGNFSAAATSPEAVGSAPRSVAVGDFDRDGKDDLAVANRASNNVTVLMNQSPVDADSNFTAPPTSPEAVGTNPVSAAVGDFNNDGYVDQAIANSFSSNVTILLGDGTGDFTTAAASPEPAGIQPTSVAVGDFDANGKDDLAVANFGSANVTILLGDGTGNFTAAGTSPEAAGTGPVSVAVGDFDANGKDDLAVANFTSNNVTILLGDGTGNFTAAGTSPEAVGTNPRSVAVGDFDGNGKDDLAVANEDSDNVSILLGDGTGNFGPAGGSPETVGDRPNSVAIGDFDANGKDDLAVANLSSNNVTILLGDGSGNFTAAGASPEAVGGSPNSVAIGDFDANGKDDLAVANAGSQNVTILLGDGTGNFSAAATSPEAVGSNPQSVVVGDFYRNGKDDLAVANYFSHNVTILLGGDTTAPNTTIDTGPANNSTTNDPTPTFEFSSNEANSTFTCSLVPEGQAASFGSCSGPANAHTSNPALADGDYTFSVRATDAANNSDATPETRDLSVDATAPNTTIDTGPVNNSTSNDSTPEFEFSSNEANSTFTCSLVPEGQAANFGSCSGPANAHTSNPALADGDYTFSVRATDAANNFDSTPASRDFTVDTTAPNTTIDIGPANNSTTNDPTPTFEFSSNEANSTFTCSLVPEGQPASFGSCSGPGAHTSTPALADGDYTFSVRATDAANNTDATPETRDFTVDATPPTLTIDSGPTGSTTNRRPIFGFTAGAGTVSVVCSLDQGTEDFGACWGASSHQPASDLADGNHTFRVVATDAVGDFTSKTQTFSVITPPADDPVPPADGGGTGDGGEPATATASSRPPAPTGTTR